MTTQSDPPTPAVVAAPEKFRRRAKIVCTLEPVTQSAQAGRALVDAGMDMARLNLSHGSHEAHAASYRYVREASNAPGKRVGILADLQGPKIRLGRFAGGSAFPGAKFMHCATS